MIRGGGILLEKLPTPEVLLEQSLKNNDSSYEDDSQWDNQTASEPLPPASIWFSFKALQYMATLSSVATLLPRALKPASHVFHATRQE